MGPLLLAALAWSPVTLIPVVAWAVARTASPATRRRIAWGLGVGGLVALALTILRFGETATLEVLNPFFDPRVGRPVPFVVDRVTVPAWQAPLCFAFYYAASAIWIGRKPLPVAPPCPVVFTCWATGWTLAFRLVLERSAAPQPLTFAVGVTVPTLVLLPFVGRWSGQRGWSYKKLLGMGLLIGVVQRVLLVAIGWACTLWGLGTHLDVGAIERVNLLVGERDFTGSGNRRLDQWWTLLLVPQLMLWVPLTVVLTGLLGTFPWRRARARDAGAAPAAEG